MIITVSGCGSHENNAAVANVLAAFLNNQKCPVHTDEHNPPSPRSSFNRFQKVVRQIRENGSHALVEIPAPASVVDRFLAAAYLVAHAGTLKLLVWAARGNEDTKPADPDDIIRWLESNSPEAYAVTVYHMHGMATSAEKLVQFAQKDTSLRAAAARLPLQFEFVNCLHKAPDRRLAHAM